LSGTLGLKPSALSVAEKTNLQVLGPSRKKPKAGDVFATQPPDGKYLFGRVIDTEAAIGPMKGCILIYLFQTRSDSKEPPARGELTPAKLLFPPVMTNQLPWSRGYFETIAHSPLEPGDVLEVHCFRRSNGQYFDEANNELPGPVPPVGDWGLHSYRTIDDQISDALGFPRAAE
jgi:Immunity protein 26